MKRWKYGLTALLLTGLLGLSGCSSYPEQAADGTPWDPDWTMLGSVLGAEEPGNGFSLQENYSVLTGEDIYYATWVAGESSAYTNEDGEDVDVYDAQLYLLAVGCADESYALQNQEDWIARQQETYTVTETWSETRNGQEYTLLAYECGSETNPYQRGVSAFTVYGNYAISAELACRAEFTGQEREILLQFLDGCHYSL
ncbi:hypothetical protein B5G43_09585 [Flavonifractor sp. An92]|uniref:hypothetical protein n=1 Tax=Flavonifractor sp. An92 TaxID=1965666 RepID=UPI000B39C3A1|nr:hypothetical protein [Flavonifractor sp. An92]OUN06405.1 hypothetical protein B5G43_09585 [Flavonifractor sp. An92]